MVTDPELLKIAINATHTTNTMLGKPPVTDAQALVELRADEARGGSTVLGTLLAMDRILKHMPYIPGLVLGGRSVAR